MNLASQRFRKPALVLIEVIVSIGLLLMILGAFTWALTQFAAHIDVVHARGRALHAAEAVMNELRAGVPKDKLEGSARFSDMVVQIEQKPGGVPWTGLLQVSVTVSAPVATGVQVTQQLSGYLPENPR